MSTNGKHKPTLDPEAPGLDEDTRRRRRVLAAMEQMSPDELVASQGRGHLDRRWPTRAAVSRRRRPERLPADGVASGMTVPNTPRSNCREPAVSIADARGSPALDHVDRFDHHLPVTERDGS
jgi:hypothetical protein